MMQMTRIVTIDTLGAQADGIAHEDDGDLFVPYALPGERLRIQQDGSQGEIIEILSASAQRVTPPCPHFGHCGGCVLQQATPDFYQTWKQTHLAETLRQGGLNTVPEPMQSAHGSGRRRMTIHARRIDGHWQVGFMARRSHQIIAITHCMLGVPALQAAFSIARSLVEALGGDKPLDVQITATESGLDVDMRGYGPVSQGKRRVLSHTAAHLGLARLSVHHDLIVEQRPPQLRMGSSILCPPSGGFLQATEAGETLLAELVLQASAKAKSIADLFAGAGTFSLRLAQSARVHAVEHDAAALAALERAARNTSHLKPLSTEQRDLFKRPLLPTELTAYDTVVFDPPRAGAQMQVQQLARSSVKRIVAVSCNPATFVRDAKILIEGGYALEKLWPVDQFLYSAHLELVALFTKAKSTSPPRRLFS